MLPIASALTSAFEVELLCYSMLDEIIFVLFANAAEHKSTWHHISKSTVLCVQQGCLVPQPVEFDQC